MRNTGDILCLTDYFNAGDVEYRVQQFRFR